MKKILVVMIGLCLLLSVAAFAQTTPAKKVVTPAAKVIQASGVIKSADASSLVVTHKVDGKDTDTTFVLNADTVKHGDMTPGAKVTVHYKVDGSQNIATDVKATPAPAPKPVTKKK